jgi:hypothetical protein
MARKILIGALAGVLLVTIAVFAAEKVKEKTGGERPKGGERGERFEQHEGLLDQLAEAYKANDREKMGQIIEKMEQRREKIREFVKLNRWHKWSHRRMARQMEFGCGQGERMAGPWQRGRAMEGPGWNRGMAYEGCPMAGARSERFQEMDGRCRGMRGGMWPMAGGFGQMPSQQGNMGMNNRGPEREGCVPMRGGMGPMAGGFGERPCQQGNRRMNNQGHERDGFGPMGGWERYGFEGNCEQGRGPENMERQGWNMPRPERHNVPPAEWGW